MPIKFRWPQDINAIRFGATLVWGAVNGIITTIQGTSPLALVNAVAGRIKSLVQYGKCITVDDEIYCNNGKLVAVDDELPAGYKRLLGITFDSNIRYETGEALTGDDDVTMTLDNLSSSGKNVFGSYNGANGKNFSLYIYGSASTGSYFRFGDQLKRPKYGTGKRTITFGKSGTSGFDSDSDVTPDEFTTPANVYIGMLPNSSSAAYAGDIIGSIIVSNRLEWIPCERESDGVIGYYEKYNGNFLEPVGSGLPVSLGYDTSHLTALSVVGTPEVLMVTGEESESLSGDIVSFEVNKPSVVSALNVNVEPIQDLHGYDSPWPAGGGVSKCPSFANGTHTMTNGLTVTIQDGEITINGTASGSGYYEEAIESTVMPADAYVSLNNPVGTYNIAYVFINGNTQIAAPSTAPANATKQPTGLSGATVNKLRIFCNAATYDNFKMSPIVHDGSTPQAWQPYSNICPISGRTSATVTRTGKNLLNQTNEKPSYYKTDSDGAVTNTNSTFGWGYASSCFKSTLPAGDYTLIVIAKTANGALGNTQVWSPVGSRIAATNNSRLAVGGKVSENFTLSETTDIGVCFKNYGGYNWVMIVNRADSSLSTFEPYSGITYAITFPSEAGTVYGGTLDVTSGVLTVTHAFWTKNTADMDNAEVYPGWKNAGMREIVGINKNAAYDGVVNVGTKYGVNTNGNNDILYLPTSYINKTQTEWQALAIGVQIVIPLATPFEITLTPTQIETLIGTNNIWADTGSIESLKYKAMQTASVENLFAVDDIKDEQNIVSGTVTRRCEAVISDGTAPSGRYIGEVGEGNIIVKARETGYEGDVATFEADSVAPLNGLTVNVSPIQDLHGYDSPWPAGGGKNLLDTSKRSASSAIGYGCTFSIDTNNVFRVTGTVSKQYPRIRFLNLGLPDLVLPAGTYKLVRLNQTGNFSPRLCDVLATKYLSTTPVTFTEETTFTTIISGTALTGETIDCSFQLMVVDGNAEAPTTYSPYSNICPISGRTSATVTRTGKNLLPPQNIVGSMSDVIVSSDGDIVTLDGTASAYGQVISDSTFILPKGTYRLKAFVVSGSASGSGAHIGAQYQLRSPNGHTVYVQTTIGSSGVAFTLSETTEVKARVTYQSQVFSDYNVRSLLVVGSSEPSDFVPYVGNTYTIQLGDTVYGGTLDVTAGKIVVDRAMVDLGTLTWQPGWGGFYSIDVIVPTQGDAQNRIVCSHYPVVARQGSIPDHSISLIYGGEGYASNGDIYVKDTNYDNASAFKSAMSGVQLCYELAEPIEITLTPTQIETLLGQNNIWSDAGSVEAYVADGDVIEHVTAQPLRTAEGNNTVAVTSAVDPVQLEIDYYKNE